MQTTTSSASKLLWWLMTSFAAIVLAFATAYATSNSDIVKDHERRIATVEKNLAVDSAVTAEQLKAINGKIDELLKRQH